jgi:hypothetical protein
VIKEADLQNPRAGLKKGVWGESRLTFESIVEAKSLFKLAGRNRGAMAGAFQLEEVI